MKGDFRISNELIQYDKIDTYEGQSGSPICIEANNNERYIIGVHVRGTKEKNYGIYLNKRRIQQIKKWLNHHQLNEETYSIIIYGYKLNLKKNFIGDEGVMNLSKCDNLKNLITLNLKSNYIGNEGVMNLSKCENLNNLTTLNLSLNNIGDEGVMNLSKCDNLNNLTTFDLRYNVFQIKP